MRRLEQCSVLEFLDFCRKFSDEIIGLEREKVFFRIEGVENESSSFKYQLKTVLKCYQKPINLNKN